MRDCEFGQVPGGGSDLTAPTGERNARERKGEGQKRHQQRLPQLAWGCSSTRI